ncbi:MAG: clostripain-related cysteine peptidase [Firmicutes bacterium]|nr:clostripain-related cysteine peptidase [Bacillota bacterium]
MKKLVFISVLILFNFIAAAPVMSGIKPYTIMVYMNGSDLESDFGLATDDLAEMLESGIKSRNANVIILTGGTNRWLNDAIPESECIIWELSDGRINEVKPMGKISMGNPATLRDFIKFSVRQYPAEKYGLIMWDHGGGSIAGFGHDEKFNDDSLSLLDMKQAFEEAGLRENKLEFLGFDACLMATVEMAVLAADYAHVMIASEDLEPGEGWDYNFLSVLNRTPRMNGFALAKVIVNTFIDFFGEDSDEILTLSVVDLAKVKPVMETMGSLMNKASGELKNFGFHKLAERRAVTKTFGEGSPRDNYADMVDIGHMAILLCDLFPQEARAVLQALEDCVVYNRHNSDIDLWGLSTFYIYGGKSQGEYSLQTYTALGMDNDYTGYLHKFFEGLLQRGSSPVVSKELALLRPVSENVYRMMGLLQTDIPAVNYLWPKLNGHSVVLFPIAATAGTRLYVIPAQINNREVNIIVSFSEKHPRGKILGSRKVERVLQKGYDPILPGDKIAIYYPEWSISGNAETWHKGESFNMPTQTTPYLTWELAPATHKLCYRITNARGVATLQFVS